MIQKHKTGPWTPLKPPDVPCPHVRKHFVWYTQPKENKRVIAVCMLTPLELRLELELIDKAIQRVQHKDFKPTQLHALRRVLWQEQERRRKQP